MLVLMTSSLAARIIEAREEKGWTQEELARRVKDAGGSQTRGAVGNWELGGGISRKNLQVLAKVLEKPVGHFLGERAKRPAAPAPKGQFQTIVTQGEVAAGQWLDLDFEIDPNEFEQHPIAADPRYPFEAQYGLIVRGTSINRIAMPGDVLHCLDVGISAVEFDDDDLVIVERRRQQQGQKEVTAKKIKRSGNIIVLAPDSDDPRWKPLRLDPKKARLDEEIAVIALVIAVYKPLRRRK